MISFETCPELSWTLTYIVAERAWTYSTYITWSLSNQSIGASVGSIENTASSIVACWTVFTELLPGNVLIKSVTIHTYIHTYTLDSSIGGPGYLVWDLWSTKLYQSRVSYEFLPFDLANDSTTAPYSAVTAAWVTRQHIITFSSKSGLHPCLSTSLVTD
jgi:hypothetical protein